MIHFRDPFKLRFPFFTNRNGIFFPQKHIILLLCWLNLIITLCYGAEEKKLRFRNICFISKRNRINTYNNLQTACGTNFTLICLSFYFVFRSVSGFNRHSMRNQFKAYSKYLYSIKKIALSK